jgi:hypothetical protein
MCHYTRVSPLLHPLLYVIAARGWSVFAEITSPQVTIGTVLLADAASAAPLRVIYGYHVMEMCPDDF